MKYTALRLLHHQILVGTTSNHKLKIYDDDGQKRTVRRVYFRYFRGNINEFEIIVRSRTAPAVHRTVSRHFEAIFWSKTQKGKRQFYGRVKTAQNGDITRVA